MVLCCWKFFRILKKCCCVAALLEIFEDLKKKCCYVAVLINIFKGFEKNVSALLCCYVAGHF